MADVGRLRWVMTADTRGFERGVDRIRTGLVRLGRLGAGMLGGAGIVGGARAGLATADAIGKIADATGVTTTELQQLRFAIQESGGTAAEMDNALGRFSRRIGELATTHRGQLAEFLRRTNEGLFLTIKRADSTTEALMALSRAMSALPDQRSRQALAAAAFGRAPVGLINLLGRGPAGMRGAMGRIPAQDFLAERMIRDAEKTQDEILKLTERATLALSKMALNVNSFIQDLRRQFERSPSAMIGQGAANLAESARRNWVLRILGYRPPGMGE